MSGAFVQVAPDSTGKKVQTFENTIGVDLVESQGVVPVDSSGVPIAPLTDAQLRAAAIPVSIDNASIPVTGTFWQATQPVSGSLSVSNFPASQTVSGTVTANAGTGTFAISAASLPLPSGAATSAKQPAIGTAGTASADVLSVQGIASMIALKVDGSAVTQPVSAPTITKGTQGGTGLTTQDLKDAGRTFVVMSATNVAQVTTEALISFTANKGGTNNAAGTSYTVTAGKTFRLTGLFVGVKQISGTAAVQRAEVRIRSAASVLATSPIVAGMDINYPTGTAALQQGAEMSMPIPDGIEIAAGQQIGISHVGAATTGVVTVYLYGFEY